MTPGCYECEHRRDIPGDAHSRCAHPEAALGGAAAAALGIRAQPHAVASGWFFWPFNFDPRWLLSCTGYQAKETTDAR